MLGVPKFEIGHVNINDAVHPVNAFEAIVCRGVVHDRQTQPALDGDYQRFEDLRNDMLGRDKVDVVTTDALQIQHDLRELGGAHLRAFAELAGLEILAEHAAQIAPTEKDRARPVPAAQAIFLAKMRKRAGHTREPSAFTHADLVVEPVDLTVTRADFARAQRLNRLSRALLKKVLLKGAHIYRDEIFPR